MERLPLAMCFKGARDYLQGADVFNAICEGVSSVTGDRVRAPLRLAMHRLMHHQCDMLLAEPGVTTERPIDPSAEFSIASSTGERIGWLIETERTVDCRMPFHEDDIERLCRMSNEGRTIEITGTSAYSPMEVTVSMTKRLHNGLYPAPQGKWIFTRLELNRLIPAEDADSIRIHFQHNFNNRLTKSAIGSASGMHGSIYFTLIPK